jgi:hypothetical protein
MEPLPGQGLELRMMVKLRMDGQGKRFASGVSELLTRLLVDEMTVVLFDHLYGRR